MLVLGFTYPLINSVGIVGGSFLKPSNPFSVASCY